MADDIITVDMDISIGIMGIKVVEKNINGDRVETRKGSFARKFIHPFYVVVEDELAKEVIGLIACEVGNLPLKYIFSGVWGNQAACLFGFLLYAQKLKRTNIPSFSIVAIDDGDIASESKEKRLNGLLKGNIQNSELAELISDISTLLLSLQLEHLENNVKGLPEYNHKKWFEEINEEMIRSVNKPSDLYEERQVESILKVIDYSRGISLDDYHGYYEELFKFSPGNTLDFFHKTEYFVLNSIKKYNRKKWNFYTSHIKEALIEMDKKNRKNFMDSDVYFQ